MCPFVVHTEVYGMALAGACSDEAVVTCWTLSTGSALSACQIMMPLVRTRPSLQLKDHGTYTSMVCLSNHDATCTYTSMVTQATTGVAMGTSTGHDPHTVANCSSAWIKLRRQAAIRRPIYTSHMNSYLSATLSLAARMPNDFRNGRQGQ